MKDVANAWVYVPGNHDYKIWDMLSARVVCEDVLGQGKHLGFIFQGFNLFPALTALQQLHCDLVLLGVSSIDPEHGITTPYLESAETKRVIIKAGAKVMSLITPEKFGRISTYRIAGCNELDVIVTEGTPDCAGALAAMGVAVRTDRQ